MAIDHAIASHSPTAPARRRFLVAWQDPDTRVFESIGRLEVDPQGYRFYYLPRARQIPGLRPLPQFPDLDQVYESGRLFVLFSQRLMNRRRPDYSAWVNLLGLDQDAPDLDVLARSEGQRLGDNIRLFPEPRVSSGGRSEATFFVHGVRHRMDAEHDVRTVLEHLRPKDPLILRPEPANQVNPLAVTVDHSSTQLGWVPNPLVEYVNTLLNSGPVDARVEQNNGPDAPPNLRLLVTVKGRVPEGYQPFGAA